MNARILRFTAAFVLLASAAVDAFAEGFAGLGSDAQGFAEVLPGKALVFPEDYGAHPGFRIEWWYLTANLKDDTGSAYGVQWTLFRQAMTPGPQKDGWSNQQVWMGHAAVTSATLHLSSETLARGGIGQAGVVTVPFRAWIDDWEFSSIDPSLDGDLSRAKVTAAGSGFRYMLNLAANGPLVRHGNQGFSQKSERGQASYYYSQPFFTANGTLTINGRKIHVSGQAWMDREWSSRPLAADQQGWEWFSLHFASGEKLMVFRLRSSGATGFAAGTWITSDGTPRSLTNDQIALTPLFESRLGDHSLPTAWRIKIETQGLDIETAPLNVKSWMATSIPYWEGPVRITGSQAGRGYLEMTGY